MKVGPLYALHGPLELNLELDGDVITACNPVVGYLHRGLEKMAENMTYMQFLPLTDRLDSLSALSNSVACVMAVEQLAGITLTPRCQAIRLLCCELARIASHLFATATLAMQADLTSFYTQALIQREKLLTLIESLTGARINTHFMRIGSLRSDLPKNWLGRVHLFLGPFLQELDTLAELLDNNTLWRQRTEGLGYLSPEIALSHAVTGPNLRASGIDCDLRKRLPYLGYEQYDFEVVIGKFGDVYDRYRVRMEEMRQSVAIINQVIETLPEGPIRSEGLSNLSLPPKSAMLTEMEALSQAFMLTIKGPQVPPGEAYVEIENPKGALGFFLISKGGGTPYRLKIRPPSLATLSLLPKIAPGTHLEDLSLLLASLDFSVSECDR
ncbi:MAG TPA: NADH-quinone oxidoreductase subunit D [Opitutae bacterium]|nr:NADH-quinone oxidoreductase subunit D [Opitutae bacterium]